MALVILCISTDESGVTVAATATFVADPAAIDWRFFVFTQLLIDKPYEIQMVRNKKGVLKSQFQKQENK